MQVGGNFVQVGAQQGWQCPICKRVLSPWTPECPCHGQGMQTFTTTGGDGEAYRVVPYKDSTTGFATTTCSTTETYNTANRQREE